jgi:phosphatidate cytidylyltransferase
MTLINNPLNNPLLVPVTLRLVSVLGAGLILVLIFNIKNLKGLFQSEVWKRYIAWVFMAPTFLLAIFLGGIPALLFISFLIYKASSEYWEMLGLPFIYRKLLLVNAVISIVISLAFPELITILPIIYFLLIVLVSVVNNQLEEIFNNVCYTLFGSIWISFTLVHFLLFRGVTQGENLLILIGFSVALADICAFCVGKLFYKLKIGVNYKIANLISPNKTYAGTLGNITGAVIGVLIFSSLNTNISLHLLIIMGICIGVSAILGDLSESMIKRFADVKDSSDSIPGHGGFLDRIDSLLIVIIVCFYFIKYFAT